MPQNVLSMPVKGKKAKTRIKVEEVSLEKDVKEPPEVEAEPVPEPVKEEDAKPQSVQGPKVASFSQLDADKSVPGKPQETLLPPSPVVEQVDQKEEEKSSDKEPIQPENIKEWLKQVRPDTSKELEKSGGPNFKSFFVIMVVLALLGAMVGGVVYYQRNVVPREGVSITETKEETPTPEPTPAPPEVDLKELTVNILNGSGTKGEAGRAKDLIVKAGFEGDKVKTGNAGSYDHKETEVQLKEGQAEAVFEKIKEALSKDYEVVKSDTLLKKDSSYEVVIIVGSRKK